MLYQVGSDSMFGIGALYHKRFNRLLNTPCCLSGRDGVHFSKMEIGDLGERVACAHIKARGSKVLYRNYRGPKGGEVDVVVRDEKTLAFVEVKTRTRRGFGRPLDAVDVAKQELIERGANSWLHLLGRRDMPWRFDVIEVILSEGEQAEINWVLDVF